MTSSGTENRIDSVGKCRVMLVLAAITLAALGNIRLALRTWTEFVRTGPDHEMGVFLARFQRLEPYLPARDHVGYLFDSREYAGQRRDSDYQAIRAQYALAPRMIERFTDQDFVIFDSPNPAALPQAADGKAWQLVVDMQDGLKLFRRPSLKLGLK